MRHSLRHRAPDNLSRTRAAARCQERTAMVVLWTALALLLILVLAMPASAAGVLGADEAHRRAEAGEILIVDVRSPREWRQTGLPKGAAAVTIHNPNGAEGFLAEMLTAVGGDKSKPVALICASGTRSNRALRYLESRGFTNLYDVREGMMGRGDAPGWLKRGLPTQPCKNC